MYVHQQETVRYDLTILKETDLFSPKSSWSSCILVKYSNLSYAIIDNMKCLFIYANDLMA